MSPLCLRSVERDPYTGNPIGTDTFCTNDFDSDAGLAFAPDLDPADLEFDDARGLLPDAAPTIRDLGVHAGGRRG
jgi:hypothetical protein